MEATQGALEERYEILEELGRGGFGVVHKARQRATKQLVAIKVLNLETASDPSMRREQQDRFTREMELIASLTSPHIVRLVDAGFTGDDPFMALEYIRGQELADVLKEGPLDAGLVKLLADQVLRALAEAHEHGIVHRDLKPQNIMLTGSGRRTSAKVLDFGIAGIQESFKEEEQSITRQGQIRGTPEYMAPEQFMFFSKPEPQMDVYALGLVLYECLTGTMWIRPGDVSNKYRQHKEEPLALTPALRGSPWGTFLERACAKEPKERFASADDMLEALHRMDQGVGPTGPISPDVFVSGGGPKGPIIPSAPTLPAEKSSPVEVLHSKPTLALNSREVPLQKTKSPVLWLALVVLVLGGLGGAWVLFGGQRDATTPKTETAAAAPQAAQTAPAPESHGPTTPAAVTAAEAIAAEGTEQEEPPRAESQEEALSKALVRAREATAEEAWEDALSAYQEALALDPEQSVAHEGMGFALLALERHGEAVEHFETARKNAALAASSTFGLAQAQAANEEWDAAEAHCKESIEVAPSGARADAAKTLLAELEAARADREKAASSAARASETDAAHHRDRRSGESRRRHRRRAPAADGVKVDTSI